MRDTRVRMAAGSGDTYRRRALRKRLASPLASAIAAAFFALLALPVTALAIEHEEPPTSFEPVLEAENFAITQQRQAIYDTPEYQAQLAAQGAKNREEATIEQASDPERNFSGDLCYEGENGCAGDVRLYNWEVNGYGRVRKVLFTARNGATISARIWSAVNPATNPNTKMPGIVITNGSVQADEQMYWYAAQALAKDGYLVMTFDPQGQGQSDTFGQAPDEQEGFPAQSDGRPFFDGTEDAINFFLSSPKHPYVPVPSCETGTSHAAKQNERAQKGLDAAYNPFWHELKSTGIGLAGHSYGAAGVSYIAQWDPRVKAVVAWDNLGSADPNEEFGGSGGGPAEKPCPSTPADRTVAPITKPGLGISADYFLPPTPNTSLPDPQAKSTQSHIYSEGGVDSGEIVIRGGSHLDFSFIPNQAFGASLRGADETAWYSSAWFDKYVKGQNADKRLLTNRWREDPVEAAVDRHNDGNAFSFYYYSRLDIHRANGEAFDCENLRKGCPGLVRERNPGSYAYLATDTSPLGFHRP